LLRFSLIRATIAHRHYANSAYKNKHADSNEHGTTAMLRGAPLALRLRNGVTTGKLNDVF
jgi:hypothetical protein